MTITGAQIRRSVVRSACLEWVSRTGLASRALLHLIVATLAIRVATGDRDEKADANGALQTVAEQPFGRLLVLAAAAGFAGYATWGFLQALVDPEGKGSDAKGIAKRLSYAGRGVLYVGFTLTALSLAGGRGQDGSGNEQADITARILTLPLGRWLVGATGLVVVGVGVFNGWKGVTRRFEKDLKRYEMTPRERCWTTRLAVSGLLARMAAFCLVGGFLVRAAIRTDPQEGVGLDAALHEVAERSYGPWMLAVVAAGLIAFGLHLLVQARYRRVLDG